MSTLPLDYGTPKLEPRPYQQEALDALHTHLATKDTNPCVVLPTGAGKSVVIAWIIQKWKLDYPPLRVAILAHRKELVAQNSQELAETWPGADIGVYAAGLNRRDRDSSILYASIDSVWNKGGDFKPFDVVIVDEAHRIPPAGEGKYRQFIKLARIANKDLRVIGFTATAYRMSGPLCHKDHILHEVCYEANVGALIAGGFLCNLRSKRSKTAPNLANVKRNSGGDYVTSSLAQATNDSSLVDAAIADAARIIGEEQRKSIVFFCVDVEHVKKVSAALASHGINAPYVTANTPEKERDRICSQFKAGQLSAICNVNVYTEGFNAKQVDCIVLLRPTLSKGLYVQMVGRGLRTHPDKADCLILDYAHCIDEHGPIDRISEGSVTLVDCGNCGDTFSRQIRVCPHCGWRIPKEEIEREAQEERERRLHEKEASQRAILAAQPEECHVDDVWINRHSKPGKPDSLCVTYRCGIMTLREWVCLDHDGYAGQKARQWWLRRFGEPIPNTESALQNLFLANQLKEMTETVTFTQTGKYREIVGYRLKRKALVG